jgi:hypothetical protein
MVRNGNSIGVDFTEDTIKTNVRTTIASALWEAFFFVWGGVLFDIA